MHEEFEKLNTGRQVSQHAKKSLDCVCWFEGNEDGGLPSARAISEGVLPPGVGGKLLADVLGLMVLGNLLGGV